MIRKLLFVSLLTGLAVVAAGYAASPLVSLNLAVGYLSGAAVLAFSSFGYWQFVRSESGTVMETAEEPEPDDRYGLWEEDAPAAEAVDAAALLAEERARMKARKKGLLPSMGLLKGAVSVYRLIGYLILIVGLMWLISSDRFEPVAYLIGVGLPPLLMSLLLWINSRSAALRG